MAEPRRQLIAERSPPFGAFEVVQLCEIHPDIVTACSWRYDLQFDLPRPSADKIESWQGTHAWGGEPEQHLVYEEEL